MFSLDSQNMAKFRLKLELYVPMDDGQPGQVSAGSLLSTIVTVSRVRSVYCQSNQYT